MGLRNSLHLGVAPARVAPKPEQGLDALKRVAKVAGVPVQVGDPEIVIAAVPTDGPWHDADNLVMAEYLGGNPGGPARLTDFMASHASC